MAKWGLKLLASFAEAAKQALENAVKIIILIFFYKIISIYQFIIKYCIILFCTIILSLNKNIEYIIETMDVNTIHLKFKIKQEIQFKIKQEIQKYFNLTLKIDWWYLSELDLKLPSYEIKLEKGNENVFAMEWMIIPNFRTKKVLKNNLGIKLEKIEINNRYGYNYWKNFHREYQFRNKIKYLIDIIKNMNFISNYREGTIENYYILRNLISNFQFYIKEYQLLTVGDILMVIGGETLVVLIIFFIIFIYLVIWYAIQYFQNYPYPVLPKLSKPIGNPNKFAILIGGYMPLIAGEKKYKNPKNNTNYIYKKLLELGYTDDTIIYLNAEGTDIIYGKERVDGYSSKKNVEAAIVQMEIWTDPTDQILIYIVGDGLNFFGSHCISLNYNNIVWDWEMEEWINCWYGGYTGADYKNYEKMIFVIESCFSGNAVIKNLYGISRIVITSTDEFSYAGYSKINGLGYFTEQFFKSVNKNMSIRDSFIDGVNYVKDIHVSAYPFPLSQLLYSIAKPLLDDNGDGIGHEFLPENGDGEDVGLAHTTYI
ncbi:MAG: hypothetical protein ACTSRP_23945 [Candidatus Helarchaeota archaeon]